MSSPNSRTGKTELVEGTPKNLFRISMGDLASAALLVFWIDLIKISHCIEPLKTRLINVGYERLDAVFLGNLLAAALNLVITISMNFVTNKYLTYRQKSNPKRLSDRFNRG